MYNKCKLSFVTVCYHELIKIRGFISLFVLSFRGMKSGMFNLPCIFAWNGLLKLVIKKLYLTLDFFSDYVICSSARKLDVS